MKKIFFLTLFFVSFSFCEAQMAFSGAGDKKLDLGINAFGYGTGITGRFDYGLLNWLSVGGGVDFYWNDRKDYGDFFLYGRANVHVGEWINLPDEMDLYAGTDLGVLKDQLGVGLHAGFKYFFTDRIGAFVQIGNHGSLGVSINF